MNFNAVHDRNIPQILCKMKGTIAFEIEITMDIFLPILEIFKREEVVSYIAL